MPANGLIYDPINQYLPNFGLKYTLGSGHDEVYGYTPNDVFDVSLGSKIIIDDSSSDSDTLILRRPISEITLETIDAEANRYRIRNRLSPDEGTIEITSIENIAIQYGDLSPTYFTYDVSSFFASPPLLIRGLPEDRVGDWLAGSESQSELLSVYLTVLTNQINSGATSFGLSSDGSIRIPERIFTSRITTSTTPLSS